VPNIVENISEVTFSPNFNQKGTTTADFRDFKALYNSSSVSESIQQLG